MASGNTSPQATSSCCLSCILAHRRGLVQFRYWAAGHGLQLPSMKLRALRNALSCWSRFRGNITPMLGGESTRLD